MGDRTTGGRRRRRIAYGRTALVAVVTAALAIATSAAGAGAAPREGEPFRNGRGLAVAHVMSAAPGVGSLQIGISTGGSIAELSNSLAQAQSQTVDLGLIGSSLTAQQCDGSAASVRPDQLPQPLQIDNRKGAASASSDEAPLAGSALSGGHQEVQADMTPASKASVSSISSTVGPLLKLSGGRSSAAAGVVDGVARQAEATVSMDIDIAGIVQLSGLEWRAVHRTGQDPQKTGTFSVGRASAGVAPLPSQVRDQLQPAINALLAPSGISVDLPHVEELTEPTDLVRVTPLRILLKDSPLGATALGPVLNLSRAQRSQLFDALVGASCKLASALLVGDVSISVASGTGFLVIDLGGAEAGTGDFVAGNPFGDIPPLELPTPGLLPGADAALPGGAAGTPLAAAIPTAAAPTAAEDLGPLEQVCESLHLTRKPGCSAGAGVPLGLAGLGLTAAMAVLDWRRQRRRADAPAADGIVA